MKRLILLFCLLASSAVAQTGIKPQEAAAHAGATATVEGVANVYTAQSGMIFVDLGGSGKDSPFSAVIFARDAGRFPDAKSWNGKTVAVSGTVQIYQGKPEIILTAPEQVVVK